MNRYLFILSLLVFLILPQIASAAVALDNTTSSVTTCGSGTSCSISFTTSGSNRYIAAYVLDTNNLVTGATYGGVGMSLIQDVATGNGSERLKAYGLIAPASGANNLIISSSASNAILLGAVSYTGANQTSQPDNSTTGSFASASSPVNSSLTTVSDNSWTVLFTRTLTAATSAGNGSTFLGSDNGSDGRNVIMYHSNGPISPAGSTSMGMTWSGSNSGVTIMFSVAPFEVPPITGSGTTNRLSKFTSAMVIGNSLFSDDGSNMTLTAGNLLLQTGSVLDTVASGVLGIGSTTATSIRIGRPSGTITLLAPASLQNFTALIATTTSIVSDSATIGIMTAGSAKTTTNCSSSASPAACGSAAAGSVAMAVGGDTLVVNTAAVTANSQILITEDSSLGTRLGITCNTTTGRIYSVSARTAGTSFTIKSDKNPMTNKACLSYWIVN